MVEKKTVKKRMAIIATLAVLVVIGILTWWFWPRSIGNCVNISDVQRIEIYSFPEQKSVSITDNTDIRDFVDSINSFSFHKSFRSDDEGKSYRVRLSHENGLDNLISFAAGTIAIDGTAFSSDSELFDTVSHEYEKYNPYSSESAIIGKYDYME